MTFFEKIWFIPRKETIAIQVLGQYYALIELNTDQKVIDVNG